METACQFIGNHAGAGSDLFCPEVPAVQIDAQFNQFAGNSASDYYVVPFNAYDLANTTNETTLITTDVYVSASGSNNNDGLTWLTAFETVQHALSVVVGTVGNPVTIHVGSGLFSFLNSGEMFPLPMLPYVNLRGDGPASTVLDAEQSGCIFYFYQDESIIQEMTCTRGDDTEGGGAHIMNSTAEFTRVFFSSNSCDNAGGAVNCENSELALISCEFSENHGSDGGGLYLNVSNCTIMNCLFENNTVSGYGGGVQCLDSNLDVNASTFTENTATNAGAAHIVNSANENASLSNCIFWNDSPYEIGTDFKDILVTYSDVDGGYSGDGNINQNPLFIAGNEGDYYLSQISSGQMANSPCLNAGNAHGSDICFDLTFGSVCLNELTTRTDETNDLLAVNLGYHYIPDALLMGRISGFVTLERPDVPAPDPSWVEMLQVTLCQGGRMINSGTTLTDPSGTFIINAPVGQYDILVKGSHTLANRLDDVLISYDDTTSVLDFGILREGDANDDNTVLSTDFFIIKDTYNLAEGDEGYDDRADFNEDGVVTSTDFFLLRDHYNVAGDTCGS